MGEWRDRALCSEMIRNGEATQEWWFPERGDDVNRAKAVCAACPVEADCLDWALANNEKDGIWGGTSGRGRRGMDRVMPCCICDRPVNVGRTKTLKARCSDACETRFQNARKRPYVDSGRAVEVQKAYRARKANVA